MIAAGEAMDVRDWGPACLSGRREPEHDPLAEEFVGPWCDPGDSEPIPGRCGVAPLHPDEEARLRASYTRREPYWNTDWSALGFIATIDAARRERDEARSLLDQQAALHAEAERIDRNAIDRCAALAERVGVLSAEVDDVRGDLADAEAEIVRWRVGSADLEAERDAALAHAGTLLAVIGRVADRLTVEEGADVAALVARVARERQVEREALIRAEAERDALRAAVRAERLAAAEYAVAIDGGTDQEVARAWKKDTDAKQALLALLPPEAT